MHVRVCIHTHRHQIQASREQPQRSITFIPPLSVLIQISSQLVPMCFHIWCVCISCGCCSLIRAIRQSSVAAIKCTRRWWWLSFVSLRSVARGISNEQLNVYRMNIPSTFNTLRVGIMRERFTLVRHFVCAQMSGFIKRFVQKPRAV